MPGSSGGSVGLAWEKILGGPRELELGSCKGTAAEVAWPWKNIGNVIVNVGVKQAQTQEAKRVHRGMWRDGACDCTVLIDLFFVLLGKVIQELFMTLVPSSCFFDDTNPLERCTVFRGLPWVCCVDLQAVVVVSRTHVVLWHVQVPPSLGKPRAIWSAAAEHHSELLRQRILCCLLP